NAGSGGGMSALTYRTLAVPGEVTKADLIAIAGGGGTSPKDSDVDSHAGEGGGLSGGDAFDNNPGIDGLGGDQNSGGGSTNANPGGYLVGGNSVLNGGAGGGGYYGGGS
ncbi:hypothetical protein G3567_13290, partial [Psychroflexus sp. YR1-1]|nr:hypothetical protein [Psychroflexus aurantiacus]